jgi:hypothetical protein
MMGQQPRTESLFYYFRLEAQIPADHLLRMIDSYVDFSFVRERLKNSYSPMGRPSIEHSLFQGFAAVCDAAFLNAAGIPSVICGPGNILKPMLSTNTSQSMNSSPPPKRMH